MTPFEFVASVVVGDFVQQAITHNCFSIMGGAIAVATFCFWSLALGWVSYRSDMMRRLFEGSRGS